MSGMKTVISQKKDIIYMMSKNKKYNPIISALIIIAYYILILVKNCAQKSKVWITTKDPNFWLHFYNLRIRVRRWIFTIFHISWPRGYFLLRRG